MNFLTFCFNNFFRGARRIGAVTSGVWINVMDLRRILVFCVLILISNVFCSVARVEGGKGSKGWSEIFHSI